MLPIISGYLGVFILEIEKIIFAKVNLNKKISINKFKFILIVLISTVLCTVFSIYLTGVSKTVSFYIIYIFEFKLLFNINYLKSIFLTVFYAILLLVSDLMWMFIVTNVVGINRIVCLSEIAGSIISNISVCVIFAVLAYNLRKPMKKLMNAEISNNIKIIFLSLMTLVCTIFFLYVFIHEFETYGNALPYFISMIVLLAILFGLIRQTILNNKLIREYDQLLEFMTTYENEIEKQRILRHETKNEFLAIKAKLCDNQKDKEIIDYIDEILKEKIIVNQEKYAKFGYLPPNGIKGLCYFKVQEAEKLGIDVSVNVSKKVKKSSVYSLNVKEQRDFGKVLGVFLDNAVEASSNSKEKKLGIEVYVNRDDEFIMIISNTFDNVINKNKIGKEKFTTKGKDRGHGLLLVKHIVDRNEIFEIKTSITNDIYVQTIRIKKLV